MKDVLRAEFFQLKKDRKNIFLIIVSIIISSVLLLDSNIDSGSAALYQTFYNMSLVFIVANVFVALFIGGNFSSRQINRYIVSGHDRKDIFNVEFLITLIYSNLILILQPIIAIVIFSVTKGWGDEYTLSDGLIIILVTILLNCSFISVITFLAFLIKNSGGILVASTALYFLMIFLLNSQKALVLARVLPLGVERLLIENRTTIFESLFVALAYLIIFYFIAQKYFEKCDLK